MTKFEIFGFISIFSERLIGKKVVPLRSKYPFVLNVIGV